MIDLLVEREIRQAVTVVRQKNVFTFKIFLDSLKTLSDIRRRPGIGEGDVPIVDITVKKLQVFAALGQDEIVGMCFVVVQEMSLTECAPKPDMNSLCPKCA